MHKTLLMLAILISSQVLSQSPSTPLILTQGITIEGEIIGYKTPALEDMGKWMGLKASKKTKLVIQFNNDVAAGKISPTSTVQVPIKINTVSDVNGQKVYQGTTRIGVTDYALTLKQSTDTLYYLINQGLPFPIVGKNNDTTGIWCYGVRKYPHKIEVGTFLPGYINEMNLFPYDLKTSRREYFNFSGGDGYSYSGFVNVRKTRTMQINSLFVYTPYYVMAKEEIEVAGKKYTAYKLLYEQLSKSNINMVPKDDPNEYFNNKYISDKVKENIANRGRGWDTPEKQAEIIEKMQTQTGLSTNEQGYMVNVIESWYVPELGLIVKTRFYDGTGALQMEMRVTSIH